MNLEKFRVEIDKYDEMILDTLKKRMVLSKKIGNYKKQNGLKVFDENRENKIISKLKQTKGLDGNFIKKLYKLIFKYSRRLQE